MKRPLAILAALGAAFPAVGQPVSDYVPRPAPAGPMAEAPPAAPAAAALAPAAHGPVLRQVVLDGATAIPEAELAPLWAPLLGQPTSPASLTALAQQISAAYRARGYALSQAVVPDQSMADGTARIVAR